MKTIIVTRFWVILFAAILLGPLAIVGNASEKMAESGFHAAVISKDVLARMQGKSYPAGCVLPLEDLRYLEVLHYGFDGKVHKGEIIVNKIVAQDVLSIFRELYEAQYPIEKMRLIDAYNANDEDSMTDNNSSGFCFRNVNNTKKISNHGKGLAIDINPLYNPYVRGDIVEPKAGQPYAFNREKGNTAYIVDNDLCVKTFAKYGFTWGGHYTTRKDYQHFEKNVDGIYNHIENATP